MVAYIIKEPGATGYLPHDGVKCCYIFTEFGLYDVLWLLSHNKGATLIVLTKLRLGAIR